MYSRLNVVNKKINVDNGIVGWVLSEEKKKHQEKERAFVCVCVQIHTIYFVILHSTSDGAAIDIVYSSVCLFFHTRFFHSKQKKRHYNIAKLLLFQLQLPNTDRILTINFLILSHSLLNKNPTDIIDVLENIQKHICTTLSHIHAMIVLTRNANEPLKKT